jgi:hypothetical protein
MKKNILKIPTKILDQITAFDQDDVVAATVKLIKPSDVERYSHLGIRLGPEGISLPSPTTPDPNAGRYSHANLYGMEKKRTDLPMYKKEFGHWAPSWGSSGTHYISRERDVYRRDFYPPKQVELSVTLISSPGDNFLVKFAIEQVINRRTPRFEQELLYNLNLLQENIGSADVFESAASLADYAASVHVDWQLLPPGTVEEVLIAMLHGKRSVTADQQTVMKERVTVMSKLKPEAYVTGTDGFLRYFGAKFGDDFVAFENAQYGNALYIMYESWETLSKKSRIEILAGDLDSFDRIEHRKGWIDQFSGRVSKYRKKKQQVAKSQKTQVS